MQHFPLRPAWDKRFAARGTRHVKIAGSDAGAPGPDPAQGRAAPTHAFHRKHSLGTKNMDIERINTIGTTLADLTARTAALRGYL